MQRKLTDRFCASAKPTGPQSDFFDADCTGLALRVFRSGTRSWMFRFTWDGARKWLVLGSYPAIGLAHARTLADEARTAVGKGHDPRMAAQPLTLHAIAEDWLTREGVKLRIAEERKAVLERVVYPALGARPIAEIRRSNIVALLDDIEDARGPAAADKALEALSRIFNWHASRTDDFISPIVRGMSRNHAAPRSRILSDEELRTVWHTAATQGAFGRMVRFLLLTGARRTEAAAMQWSELTDADWTLPAARNKTKLDLVRPLSPLALAQLPPRTGLYVFSSDGGATPLTSYSTLKATFDGASGVTGWRLHDGRRTARSLLSRAGVPTDHAERVLGHVIGGIRGVYDRHEYHAEKAHALAALAAEIDRIVSPPRPKVLTLRRVERAN
jgi:integrase